MLDNEEENNKKTNFRTVACLRRQPLLLHCVVLVAAAMPAGGWSHTGAGAPFAPISSESDFSSSTPHFHSSNFRNHYPTHSSPTLAYGPPQYAYPCDHFCHNQQQGHQDHQHSCQFQHHQQELHEQQFQNKDHAYISNRPKPRTYNLPPAMMTAGLPPPSARYYLPSMGFQSNSAQSLNSHFPPGCQSLGSTKQDTSLHSIGAPLQQFQSGTNRMNYYSETPSQSTLQSTASDMSQRQQAMDPLFFGAVPHTRALLANQHHRLASGLNPNRLGSLRPGSDFYRYD